ncbi:MAG TPA: TIGR03546 family protein [Pirellulaceae bacterium]|nr:TIGR03546 family protein [Pirellulaceae bacterium]HMO91810.1 TIGR03546 family protein [Pirellulaceae bacterium]HMP69873.1 TIGR03546 family protein [Pirellulaceae bacterium]
MALNIRLRRPGNHERQGFERELWNPWALGCALGMCIGLIPKDTLIFPVLVIALFISMSSLWSGLFSSLAFAGVSYLLDGLTQKLGALVLTSEKLEPFWLAVYDLPLIPWTGFSNTAVMGNTILALILFYPCYRLSYIFIRAYGPYFDRMIKQNRVYRFIVSRDVVARVEGLP